MGGVKGVLKEELQNSIRMKKEYEKAIKAYPGGRSCLHLTKIFIGDPMYFPPTRSTYNNMYSYLIGYIYSQKNEKDTLKGINKNKS